MENDLSARAFDTIACKSGQFGFFQKRIFFINALIQSVCLSILLYTNVCMPKLEQLNMAHGSENGLLPLPARIKNDTGTHFNSTNDTKITNSSTDHVSNNIDDYVITTSNSLHLPLRETTTTPSILNPTTSLKHLQDLKISNLEIDTNNNDNIQKTTDLNPTTSLSSTKISKPDDSDNTANRYARNAIQSYDLFSNTNFGNASRAGFPDDVIDSQKGDVTRTTPESSNQISPSTVMYKGDKTKESNKNANSNDNDNNIHNSNNNDNENNFDDDNKYDDTNVNSRNDYKTHNYIKNNSVDDYRSKINNANNQGHDEYNIGESNTDPVWHFKDESGRHSNSIRPTIRRRASTSTRHKSNNKTASNSNNNSFDAIHPTHDSLRTVSHNNSPNKHHSTTFTTTNNPKRSNGVKNSKSNNTNIDTNSSSNNNASSDKNNHKDNHNNNNYVNNDNNSTGDDFHTILVPINRLHTADNETINVPYGTFSTYENAQNTDPPLQQSNHVIASEGNPIPSQNETESGVRRERSGERFETTTWTNMAAVTMDTSTETQTVVVSVNTSLEVPVSQNGYVHPLMDERITKDQLFSSFDLQDLLQLAFILQGVGVVLGSLLGGLMADIFGRRRPLYLSLLGMATTQCALALSISWSLFLVLRTFAVGFAGATLVISFVMVIEFVGPSWRDACTCSCLWTLGAVCLSLETMATTNWRWLALTSGGLALPLLGAFYTTPESLRWLQCHHKFPAAEGVYREVVSVNSAAVPEMMSLLDQARVCIVNNMHRKRYTFLDLFYNLTSARSTFALVYTGVVSSCVYACLSTIVRHLTGNPYVDGCLPFLIDMPLTWSTIIVNRCLGRRWCLFLYSVASGLALMSVTILHMTGNVSSMPSLVTGIALFGKIGVTATISLIFLIAIEMYPTVSRGMGVGVALASGSGGIILSQVFLFLRDYHYTVPFIVYGLLMSSVGLVGLFLPETLNTPLTNVQQCRHRKIPLVEGGRQAGGPPFP